MPTAREIIQESCPRIEMEVLLAGRPRCPTIQHNPTTLTAWPNFENEVRTFPLDNPPGNDFPSSQYLEPQNLTMTGFNETACNFLFLQNVIAKLMRLDQSINFSLNSAIKSERKSIFADFVGLKAGRYEKVIGEVKRWSHDWEGVDDIVVAWNNEATGKQVFRPIRQLFAYMNSSPATYGFVTVYNTTWFFRRDPNDVHSLQVSPAIYIEDTDPSVAQCLWYILNKTRTHAYPIHMEPFQTTDEEYDDEQEGNGSDDESSGSNHTFRLSSSAKKSAILQREPLERHVKKSRQAAVQDITSQLVFDADHAKIMADVEQGKRDRSIVFISAQWRNTSESGPQMIDCTAWATENEEQWYEAVWSMEKLSGGICTPVMIAAGSMFDAKYSVIVLEGRWFPIGNPLEIPVNVRVEALDCLKRMHSKSISLQNMSTRHLVRDKDNHIRLLPYNGLVTNVKSKKAKQAKAHELQVILYGSPAS